MIGSSVRAGILITAFTLSGCGALDTPSSLRIPREQFKAGFTTLCLETLDVPFEVYDLTAKQASFERLLSDGLQAAGINTIPSTNTTAAYERINQAQGGCFDPHTGRPDMAKDNKVHRAVMKELGCQGRVTPEVVVVVSPWNSGEAKWDGVTDSLGGGSDAYGRVGALSLWITIRDADGREIYFTTGGIEILSKLEGFFFEEFAHVNAQGVLGNGRRNAQAVDTALDAISGRNPMSVDDKISAETKRREDAQRGIKKALGRPTE